MVFVHARKETVKTAQRLKEMAMEAGMVSSFETREHPKFEFYRRDIATSRNKEMKELFDAGFGIHHAGMLRSDRNMMERMFEDTAIKVSPGSAIQDALITQEIGPLLYIYPGLGRESSSPRCGDQGYSGVR